MAYTDPRTWTTGELVTAALLNTHLRDNLDAGFPTLAVWDDWTPTLTNFTLGNGTIVSRYQQVGKMVAVHFTFTLGSTSAVGTGGTISTPVTAASGYTVLQNSLGPAIFFESGSSTLMGIVRLESTTTFRPVVGTAGSTYVGQAGVTATVPFTWGTGDILAFTAVYEAA